MKLRVGFVGTGMMGLAHVQCVRDEFPQAQLAAVYDPHGPSVQRAKEAAPGLMVCGSLAELLASVDAVIISTPGFRHAEEVEKCLAAGKHVLCEKPVMTTREGCARMVQLAEAYPDRVLMINHELRYSTYFQKLTQLVRSGEVGEVQLLWCKEFRGPFLRKVGDWIQDARCSGGCMVDMNSHHFDLMNWWAGSRPRRVAGFGGNDVVRVVNNEHEVIDHASVSFEYANGVRGGLLLSMFSPNTGEDLEMGVMGSQGMLQTRLLCNEIWQWRRSSSGSEPIVHSVAPPKAGWGAPRGFYEAHVEFFRAIAEGGRPLTDVRDCVDGTLLAIVAEEAIREGKVVEVEIMQTHKLYLNGQWITSSETIKIVDPATGETFAQIATVTQEQVKRAISDAHASLAQWRDLPAKARADYLLAIGSNVEKRTDEIARAITRENGKPLAQSKGEVSMTVDHLRWFAEECRRAYGRVIPNQVPTKRNLVIKRPIGVVGAIAPWNFPLVLAIRKVAPALAAGCPVILKPASQTPVCCVMFAECAEAAKLPRGVFQLIVGSAQMIADEMLSNPLVRKITFTGSTEVGQKLIAGAARDVKHLSLELGGHAPVLVFDDAELEKAVDGAMMAKFRNTGQSCIAANRIYVQRGTYDRFVEAFVRKTKELKVGNGLEDGVEIGPLVNEKGLQAALDQIEDARSKGAKLLAGGKRWGSKGFFLEPTVLADVPDSASCMSEETFAPVAPIVKFETEEEGIARANGSRYGLSAYAFTSNLSRALRVMENLEAGTIGINDGVPTTSNAPFGGMKHSGWGRELGIEGLDAFLETKHVSIGL